MDPLFSHPSKWASSLAHFLFNADRPCLRHVVKRAAYRISCERDEEKRKEGGKYINAWLDNPGLVGFIFFSLDIFFLFSSSSSSYMNSFARWLLVSRRRLIKALCHVFSHLRSTSSSSSPWAVFFCLFFFFIYIFLLIYSFTLGRGRVLAFVCTSSREPSDEFSPHLVPFFLFSCSTQSIDAAAAAARNPEGNVAAAYFDLMSYNLAIALPKAARVKPVFILTGHFFFWRTHQKCPRGTSESVSIRKGKHFCYGKDETTWARPAA